MTETPKKTWRFMIQLPRTGDEWLSVREYDDEEAERLRPYIEAADRDNRRVENGIRAKLEPID
jgi:hypothetical protein